MMGPVTRSEKDLSGVYAGVSEITEMVGATMGGCGRSVLLHGFESGSFTNDGVFIIRHYHPADAVKARGVAHVRNAAEATVREAGDGTSTTTVLLDGFLRMARQACPLPGSVPWDFIEEMDVACADILKGLVEIADRDVPLSALEGVVRVAMHGHKDAELVAGLVYDLGKDASVLVDVSHGGETTVEKIPGFRWAAGTPSPDFFTKQGAAILENAAVAVIWDDVMAVSELTSFFEAYGSLCRAERRDVPLLIFARNLAGDALATISQRTGADGRKLPWVLVKVPAVGDAYERVLDLCAVVGAKDARSEAARRVGAWSQDWFGQVAQATVTLTEALLVPGIYEDEYSVSARVSEIESVRGTDAAKSLSGLDDRIANLYGRVGVINMGYNTLSEYDYMRLLFEDGFMAARSALADGIVPGGGWTLLRMTSGQALPISPPRAAFLAALTAPLLNILSNAGYGTHLIAEALGESGHPPTTVLPTDVFDVRLRKFVNWREGGIIDTVRALRCAVKNAWSEARSILTSNFLIINEG